MQICIERIGENAILMHFHAIVPDIRSSGEQFSLVFKNIKKLPSLRSGNFIMFLKTNLGYLSQIALENMQLLILIDFSVIII